MNKVIINDTDNDLREDSGKENGITFNKFQIQGEVIN